MDDLESHNRVRRACENCRKRKRKCDGLQPICSWCLARNIACHYHQKKPSQRHHDPDYARGLEDQVQLLREEVRRLQELHPNHNAIENDINTNIEAQEPPGDQNFNGHNQPVPRDESTAISDVSSLMWRMNIDETGEPTFIGPSGNFCFPSTRPPSHDLQKTFETYQGTSSNEAYRSLGDEPDTVGHLLNLFSTFINPIHHFLDQATLLKIQQPFVSPQLMLVKYAVLAAASLLADDTRSQEYGRMMASSFDSAALTVCRELANVSTVQAFSIMCWRELGLEQHKMAWMYNSLCAGMVLHLGLPVSSLPVLEEARASARDDDFVNLDSSNTRLKTLWSAVLMDRIATSLLGRNCMVPWRRVRAQSFLEAVEVSPTLTEVVFDHHCRLWFIHDQCMEAIYSFEFDTLGKSEQHRLLLDARERLYTFHRNMDPQVWLRREVTSPSLIILHMSYNMSQMLIHRPYLREPPESVLYQMSIRSMSTAAENMVRLIRHYEKISQLDKAPYFVSHSVMTAAITHLLRATSEEPTIRSQAIHRFRVCFNCLFTMQTRWAKAHQSILVLRQLAHRWRVVRALPIHNGFPDPRDDDAPSLSRSLEEPVIQPSTKTHDTTPLVNEAYNTAMWADVNPTDFSTYLANVVGPDYRSETDPWSLSRIFEET